MAASVIISLLFSFVCLNVHVFIPFHKLLWLAHETEEKIHSHSPDRELKLMSVFMQGCIEFKVSS